MMNVGQLSNPAIPGRWSIRPIVILAAVIVVMYLAREVLIPLAFAVVLSLIWSPPVNWLQKLHLGRAPAVLIVVILSLVAGVAIGWVISNQLIAVVNELPNYQQNIHNKIAALSSPGKGSLSRAAENVMRLGKELSTAQTAEPSARLGNERLRSNMRNQPTGPVPVRIVEEPANNLEYLGDVIDSLSDLSASAVLF